MVTNQNKCTLLEYQLLTIGADGNEIRYLSDEPHTWDELEAFTIAKVEALRTFCPSKEYPFRIGFMGKRWYYPEKDGISKWCAIVDSENHTILGTTEIQPQRIYKNSEYLSPWFHLCADNLENTIKLEVN